MKNTENAVNPARKKITAAIVKLSDYDAGHTVKGKYLGRSERPWLDKSTGEEKIIPCFTFEAPDKSRFTVFGDAGLVNAMSAAGVVENQLIEIEKLDQVDLGGGKRVNSYDIFELSTLN